MFLSEPPGGEGRERAYTSDLESDGYVNNLTRLWCWRPEVLTAFTEVRGKALEGSSLTELEVAVLVASTASARSDSYCSLAWGSRLAELTNEQTAADVLAGTSAGGLGLRERLLADWARAVVLDPNATTAADVDRLREAGFSDAEIFEATVFIAFRLAFSTVNDALGAQPDAQLAQEAPAMVRASVGYGRPPSPADSM
jgi:uncharacterized peroxidase-related enzyme